MLRIAIQTKGRLNEESVELLKEAGITVNEDKRKFLAKSADFPIEVLFLRDDDIPQTVAMGAADIGIVGYNEVKERGFDVEILKKLSFGACRISLAVPKNVDYNSLSYFNGKRIATSYPNILKEFFKEKGINGEIHTIAGSVEIAPAAGLADAIFDIVSSGSTLVSNGLKEVEKVLYSEAVLIGNRGLSADKKALVEKLLFRFESVQMGRGKKYILMNLPDSAVDEAIGILPALRSPTIMPLAQKGWCSMHSVVNENELWDKIDKLKEIGAEGILILNVEKIVA
ncbi:MAG: ATP phosphoribosyltransferase [Bacteroidales bacterium]|jgi:ATP phosphoribosyltransferase|nr:ATP phosphoribosyltransferase [Bacteroidales bacterium]